VAFFVEVVITRVRKRRIYDVAVNVGYNLHGTVIL